MNKSELQAQVKEIKAHHKRVHEYFTNAHTLYFKATTGDSVKDIQDALHGLARLLSAAFLLKVEERGHYYYVYEDLVTDDVSEKVTFAVEEIRDYAGNLYGSEDDSAARKNIPDAWGELLNEVLETAGDMAVHRIEKAKDYAVNG